MLSLAIKFGVTTTVLYMASQIAVKYAALQSAHYDNLLALIGG